MGQQSPVSLLLGNVQVVFMEGWHCQEILCWIALCLEGWLRSQLANTYSARMMSFVPARSRPKKVKLRGSKIKSLSCRL